MQKSGAIEARNVVPRWRTLARTPSAELRSVESRTAKKRPIDDNVIEKKRWELAPSIENAAELIDLAIVNGDFSIAQSAANFLIANKHQVSDQIIDAALRIVGRTDNRPRASLNHGKEDSEAVYKKINLLKKHLSDHSRDSLACVEVARLHCLIGQLKVANKYMERALLGASENRYILRCAARFFVHAHEANRGYDIISKTDCVKGDPWVQAAEVALADIVNKTPKWSLRQRTTLREQKQIPVRLSELAAGLATFEYRNGAKLKEVRRLFNISLSNPTDNAVAQVQWMKERGHINIEPDITVLKLQLASEARTHAAIDKENYDEAAKEAWNWLNDDAMSINPSLVGSYICLSFTKRFDQALQFIDAGLRSHPYEAQLLNNKFVALAMSDRLQEARDILSLVKNTDWSKDWRHYVDAAQGLLAFKEKRIEDGRAHYSKALDLAKDARDGDAIVAGVFAWLEQETINGTIPHEDISAALQNAISQSDRLSLQLKKEVQRRSAYLRRTYLEAPVKKFNEHLVEIPDKNLGRTRLVTYYIPEK